MIGGNLVERGLIGPRVVGGTWSAATTWTIPAVTLGGTLDAVAQLIAFGSSTNTAYLKAFAANPCLWYYNPGNTNFLVMPSTAGLSHVGFVGLSAAAGSTSDEIAKMSLEENINNVALPGGDGWNWQLRGSNHATSADRRALVVGFSDATFGAGAGSFEAYRILVSGGNAGVMQWGTALTHTNLKLGGQFTLNGQTLQAGAVDATIATTGAGKGLWIQCTNDGATGGQIGINSVSTTPLADDIVGAFYAQGNDDTGAVGWGFLEFLVENVTRATSAAKAQIRLRGAGGGWNTALALSSTGVLDALASYKVAGTQVVGARVVDARCDDVVDSTYGAEEAGVLDALRDAMISHGLIAAAA